MNDEQFRVTYGKGKTVLMDYEEIIRQLTHIDEDGDDKWVIDKILNHRWAQVTGKGKWRYW